MKVYIVPVAEACRSVQGEPKEVIYHNLPATVLESSGNSIPRSSGEIPPLEAISDMSTNHNFGKDECYYHHHQSS